MSSGPYFNSTSTSSSYDSTFSFLALNFCLPILLYLIVCTTFLHTADFRLWKIRVFIHRTTRTLHLRHFYDDDEERKRKLVLSGNFSEKASDAPKYEEGALPTTESLYSRQNQERNSQAVSSSSSSSALFPFLPQLPHFNYLSNRQKRNAVVASNKPKWDAYKQRMADERARADDDVNRDRIDNAEQRIWIAPFVSISVATLFVAPVAMMATWFALLVVKEYTLPSIAFLCCATSLFSLYYSGMVWKSNEWEMTTEARNLIALSITSYFAMAFAFSFVSEDVSFFSRSIHFLTLNFILLCELSNASQAYIGNIVMDILHVVKKNVKKNHDEKKGGWGSKMKSFMGSVAADIGFGSSKPKPSHDALHQLGFMSKEDTEALSTVKDFNASDNFNVTNEGAASASSDNQSSQSPPPSYPSYSAQHDEFSKAADDSAAEKPSFLSNPENDYAEPTDYAAVKLLDLPPSASSTTIDEEIQHRLCESSLLNQKYQRNMLITYYGLSLVILVVYSIVIYYTTPINGSDTDHNWGGFIVSCIIICLDVSLYLFSLGNGGEGGSRGYMVNMSPTSKLFLMGVSRIVIIAFDFTDWFVGLSIVYFIYGSVFIYCAINARFPYDFLERDLRDKRSRALQAMNANNSKPGAGTANPTADVKVGKSEIMMIEDFLPCESAESYWEVQQMRDRQSHITLKSNFLHYLLFSPTINIYEFVSIMITILFFVCMGVEYRSGNGEIVIESSSDPHSQYLVGVFSFAILVLLSLSYLLLRLFQYDDWHPLGSPRLIVMFVIVESLYGGCAYLIYREVQSIIFALLMCFIPILILSTYGTYTAFVKNDWQLSQTFNEDRAIEEDYDRKVLAYQADWRKWSDAEAKRKSAGLPPTAAPIPPSPPSHHMAARLPFLWRCMSCHLAASDYLLYFSFAFALLIIIEIGFTISYLFSPSYVGWSISLALVIVLSSCIPVYKYVNTLTLDRIDHISLCVFIICHGVLFALLYEFAMEGVGSGSLFIFWVVCFAYPSALLLFTGLYHLKEHGRAGHTYGFTSLFITSCVVFGLGVYSFFNFSTEVGIIIIVAEFVAIAFLCVIVSWVKHHYTLPWYLSVPVALLYIVLLGGCIAAAYLIEDPTWAYWAFSVSFFMIILKTVIYAFALEKGDEADTGNIHYYSSVIFPVYLYDKRLNDVRQSNLPSLLFILCFLLFYAWCVSAFVTQRLSLGLAIAAINTVAFYSFVRHRQHYTLQQLMNIIPIVTEGIVTQMKRQVYKIQLSSSVEITPVIRVAVIKGIDPLPYYKQRLDNLKRQMGLLSWNPFRRLECNYLDLDFNLRELDWLHEICTSIQRLHNRLESHFFFLILCQSQSMKKFQQGKMKELCDFISKKTDGLVKLSPYITNEEVYSTTRPWSEERIQQFRNWKNEYLGAKQESAETNHKNRVVEHAAALRRSAIMDDDDQVDLKKHAPEDVEQRFKDILAEFKKTGKKWEDPDFPANGNSIYIGGVRDPSKPSAVHAAPIADEWKRLPDIMKALKDGGDDSAAELKGDEVASIVDNHGFANSDVIQGNIGTCYLLSAMGALALRESQHPESHILSSLFPTLKVSDLHSECGAYIVRLYRQTKELKILIDDRLPVQPNGYPAFSHCRRANEWWVALVEKAYAKLFTSYEAIEAGFISQALVDFTNGASEEIHVKDQSGNLVVNSETLFPQLKDSFDAGFLMGAGSNAGTNDHIVNGLVLGHAYMIVGMYMDKDVKLIQLQNPWGHGEWEGDWSDSSDKWTAYYKKKLNNVQADDGRFWMSFEDFLQYYECIYVCRLMPMRQSLRNRWKGDTAAGPRTPAKNPHFKLTVNTPQKVWIEVEQDVDVEGGNKSKDDRSKTLAYIQFYVMDTGGQRVQKITRDGVLGWANNGKLINTRDISSEVFIPKPGNPFTIVVCANKPGVETGFTVSVFSREPVTFEQFEDNEKVDDQPPSSSVAGTQPTKTQVAPEPAAAPSSDGSSGDGNTATKTKEKKKSHPPHQHSDTKKDEKDGDGTDNANDNKDGVSEKGIASNTVTGGDAMDGMD